jgi:hypothetical protein
LRSVGSTTRIGTDERNEIEPRRTSMSRRDNQRLSKPLIRRIHNQKKLLFAVENAHPTDPRVSATIRDERSFSTSREAFRSSSVPT